LVDCRGHRGVAILPNGIGRHPPEALRKARESFRASLNASSWQLAGAAAAPPTGETTEDEGVGQRRSARRKKQRRRLVLEPESSVKKKKKLSSKAEPQPVAPPTLTPMAATEVKRAAEEKAAAEAKRAAEEKAAAEAKRAAEEKAVAEAKRAAAGPPPAATVLSGLTTPACPVAAVLSPGALHLLSKFSVFVLVPIRQLIAYCFLHIGPQL
jgi:hypothetical protein